MQNLPIMFYEQEARAAMPMLNVTISTKVITWLCNELDCEALWAEEFAQNFISFLQASRSISIAAPDAPTGGYQPTHGGLDPSNPPRGGSGLPSGIPTAAPQKPDWWSKTLPEWLERRFWKRVAKCKQDECWDWLGGKERHGYGRFSLGQRNKWMFAHRFSWLLTFGPIPDGLCVLHRCDHPLCVNPSHLFLGTRADNIHDCMEKGRFHPPCGEANGSSKLTNEQVTEIRSRYKKGSRIDGTRALGRAYGVDHSVISEIIHRKKWRHLP